MSRRERLLITRTHLAQAMAGVSTRGSVTEYKTQIGSIYTLFLCFLTTYDPGVRLCIQDIAMDNPLSPSALQMTIQQSKTEPTQKMHQLGKQEQNCARWLQI